MKEKIIKISKKMFIILLVVLSLISLSKFVLFFSPNYVFYHPNEVKIYTKNEKDYYSRMFNQFGKYVTLDEISPHLINAAVASEDKRFYKHDGIDYSRIIKSLFDNLKNNGISSGASTITQQVARTIFLSNQKSLKRKLNEIFIAKKIEEVYSKEKILETYLNIAYFGHNLYGVEQACDYYYHKSPKNVTLAEAALLIGILPSPTNYSPEKDYEKAVILKDNVLLKMKHLGYITSSEYLIATKEKLNFCYSLTKKESSNLLYFHDALMEELRRKHLITKTQQNIGYKIYSTLDKDVQNIIENITNKHSFSSEISVIVMKPYSGDVLGLIGGKDYDISPFNRALNANRQIGSTIKPLIYYLALENGLTPLTKLKSEPTTFFIDDVGEYSPKNANNKYANKEITMLEAIALSDNIYATKVALLLGSKTIKKFLESFNIILKDANPTIGLGSNSLTPLQLTAIYNTFASEGSYYKPTFYKKILSMDDRVIHKNTNNHHFRLRSDSVIQMNYMLRSPFDEAFKSYTSPSLLNYQTKTRFSAKTGTTTSDRWVVGFNPQYTLCVWMGNDENKDFLDGNIAKLIFKEIADELMKQRKDYFYSSTNLTPFIYKNPNGNSSFTYYKN